MSTVLAPRRVDGVLRALAASDSTGSSATGDHCRGESGYGLSLGAGAAASRVYRDVSLAHAVDVVPTLLAAHVVPVEYSDRPDDYVKMIVKKMIRERPSTSWPDSATRSASRGPSPSSSAGGCSRPASSTDCCPTARRSLSYMGGTEMAASLGAVSVDHLDHVSESGIAALTLAPGDKRAPVAVLLPGATFFLGEAATRPPGDCSTRARAWR